MLLSGRPFLLGSIMATQEQLDLRKKWVDALRSGKYKQGKGSLRSANGAYCCLGVLCDVMNIPSELVDNCECYRFTTPTGDKVSGYLNPELANEIGLSSVVGGNSTNLSLAGMNDRGSSFTEIANFIESVPAGLFKD
jgi:hypothetical protein